MLSDRSLLTLRKAATLAHAIPSLALHVHAGGERLLMVGDGRATEADEPGRHMTRCDFRAAVARAVRLHAEGQALAFCGLGAGIDPEIDVRLPAGDVHLGVGIYRIRLADQCVHLFATSADVSTCRHHADGDGLTAHEQHPAAGRALAVGFHRDEATGITLVHTSTPMSEPGLTDRAAEIIGTLAGRYGTEESLDVLGLTPRSAVADRRSV